LQQQLQTSQLAVDEWEQRATQNNQLYLSEQQRYQQTLCLYNEEKAKTVELIAKYQEADARRTQYLTLYNEAQELLKRERRSKAGIKGWETRRKIENERLKQEIAEMVVLLRESLASKDEAVNNLYALAERMDRIQQLVDSVEVESTGNPVGLLQKLKRIWLAIKDILSE
jgi:HSP90 family molecular chaperone